MEKRLIKVSEMIAILYDQFSKVRDVRTGKNTQYEMSDAIMGAFAIFHMQSPSFLDGQKQLKEKLNQSNAETLYRIKKIPTDTHIRNLLDPLEPKEIIGSFKEIIDRLAAYGYLDEMRGHDGKLLIAVDGSQYHESHKISCAKCNTRVKDDEVDYYHVILAPAIVKPDQKQIFPIEPEFLEPQDGHDKQDSELAAFYRWLSAYGKRYAGYGAILLGDDLYCNEPACRKMLKAGFHFILTCKPTSHEFMAGTRQFLENIPNQELVRSVSKRIWTGRRGIIHQFRYINGLPLKMDKNPLTVNWCEYTETDEKSGECLYRNEFATDYEITDENVESIALAGRGRWNIENSGFNVLKNRGYHFEHNFGHGDQNLSAVLAVLNLLSYLVHNACKLTDDVYAFIRNKSDTNLQYFERVRVLTEVFIFEDWDKLFELLKYRIEHGRIPISEFLK